MAERTWESRELPLLEALAKYDARGEAARSTDDLIVDAGVDRAPGIAGLRALYDAKLITGIDAETMEGWELLEVRLLAPGRRVIGQWPTDDAYAELVRVLDRLIDRTDEPEERTRLTKLRDAVTDVGRGVIASIVYDLGKALAVPR